MQELIAAVVKFLLTCHAESYGIRNQERLSDAYRKRLVQKRDKARASQALWQPKKRFVDLPESSQRRTRKRKTMIDAYYTAVEMRLPSSYAELAARVIGLVVFTKAPCSKTIRRYVRRVEAHGGPDCVPLEVYADQLSVPHLKARKRKEA